MFSVTIKVEGLERRRRSTGFVHIILGFYLLIRCFDLYRRNGENALAPVLPFALIGVLSVGYGFFQRRLDVTAKHNQVLRFLQMVTYLIFGFVMAKGGNSFGYIGLFLWAFVSGVLLFTEKKAFQETNIGINEEGLKVPGSYRDHLIAWHLLERVTIRQDFITISHHGKKFLQYQVMQDLSDPELIKMNAFCSDQIEKLKPKIKSTS